MLSHAEDPLRLHCLLARREPAALEELFKYAGLLRLVVRRRFGTAIAEEDCRDIVADTLLHAWRTGERFDPSLSSVKSWLIVLTVYRAREFLRRMGSLSTVSLDHVEPSTCARHHQPAPADEQPSEQIERLLRRLPPRRARIVEMHYYEGCSVLEIAQRLEISQGAVKSHLSNGRADLRRVLSTPKSISHKP